MRVCDILYAHLLARYPVGAIVVLYEVSAELDWTDPKMYAAVFELKRMKKFHWVVQQGTRRPISFVRHSPPTGTSRILETWPPDEIARRFEMRARRWREQRQGQQGRTGT
jgi:hypothetical protein